MARYVPDHSGETLFVDGSLDSLLPDNSVARSIRHGLGEMDFSRFDAVYRNDLEGRPAIDPRCLTGLWILALLRGMTSSVQVARLCRTDVEFRWLCGGAHVQKSTLSRFRGDHSEALSDLSTQLLTVLSRVGMLPGEALGIDGTVIRAASSCGSSQKRKVLRRRMNRLKRIISSKYSESDILDEVGERLQKKQDRFEQALEEMSELGLNNDDDRITITEPEASMKRLKTGSFGPAHNVQVVTDLDSGAIISIDVIDKQNDSGQLLGQTRRAQDELRRIDERLNERLNETTRSDDSVKAVVADSAYHDTRQLVVLDADGIATYVPDYRSRRPSGVSEQFDRNKFGYDASTDTMVCPVGVRLKRRKLNNNGTAMTYQAKASVCNECSHKWECCPASSSGRSVNRPLYADVLKRVTDRVASKEGKRRMQARSVVTEGAIGRLVSLLHWRRCRTWNAKGAQSEARWRQIGHNLMLSLGVWRPLVLRPT